MRNIFRFSFFLSLLALFFFVGCSKQTSPDSNPLGSVWESIDCTAYPESFLCKKLTGLQEVKADQSKLIATFSYNGTLLDGKNIPYTNKTYSYQEIDNWEKAYKYPLSKSMNNRDLLNVSLVSTDLPLLDNVAFQMEYYNYKGEYIDSQGFAEYNFNKPGVKELYRPTELEGKQGYIYLFYPFDLGAGEGEKPSFTRLPNVIL